MTNGLRARKRKHLREALTSLAGHMFLEHGYESVSMDQIAVRADISRGTLYNHFPSKEHLLAGWIHHELAKDLSATATTLDACPDFKTGAAHLLGMSAQWCEQHKALLTPYLKFCFQNMHATETTEGGEHLLTVYSVMISNDQNAGRISSELEALHLATLFHHLYLGALMRWLTTPGLSLRDEFDAILAVFINGCGTDVHQKVKIK